MELEYCCCCVDLRIGSLAIGYISLIGNILQVIASIADLALHAAPIFQIEHYNSQTEQLADLAVSIIILALFITNLIFTILLLVGIHKHHRGHVKAYLIYTVIFIVIGIVGYLSHFFLGKSINIPKAIREGIELVLNIYFLLVIRSYYIKMRDMVINRPVMYNASNY